MARRMISVVDTMSDQELFGRWFAGSSWEGWRTILKAAFGHPLTDGERTFFDTVAGGREPPRKPIKQLWVIGGRRSGKDSIASLLIAHLAATFTDGHLLRSGERATVLCLATNSSQAKIVSNYARAYFDQVPMLRALVTRSTSNLFELANGVDVQIVANSFRSIRGRSILAAVFDEVAFWRDDTSVNPDREVYRAVLPGMASLPSSMLIGITTPYRRNGLAYERHRDYFGKDDPNVLVIVAETRQLNPLINQAVIDQSLADDAVAGASEWLAAFRDDLADFVSRDAVSACVDAGVRERAPRPGLTYWAFTDPSGGAYDSMVTAIGHREGDLIVVDVIREIASPFSPENAVDELASLMRLYAIRQTTGDRYSAEWNASAWERRKIKYVVSDLPKSGLYLNLLPRLNSRSIRLLDNQRAITQISSLERRTARGGKN